MATAPQTLTIVVPLFNEAANLEALFDRLAPALAGQGCDWDVLFVDDGSTDNSREVLQGLVKRSSRVGWLSLSRNFGKEVAMTAGIDHAAGEAVVIMDADLQDPPELIPLLLERWREGADAVYAQRIAREGESWIKRTTAALFYRVINRLSQTPVPPNTGDFRLLGPRAVAAVRQMRERHRFMKGLFGWVGYRQVAVPFRREPRRDGRSKFNYRRLWNFALEGITSFTNIPLKAASYLGFATAASALAFGVVIIFKTLFFGDPVAGYPSMMVVILFLGGVQLMALGVIGEYLGRLFDEAKGRPLYLLDESCPARTLQDRCKSDSDTQHSDAGKLAAASR